MDTRYSMLCLLSACLALALVQANEMLTVDTTNKKAMPGTTVTFNCRVRDFRPAAGHTAFLAKRINEQDGLTKSDVIATNQILTTKYSEARRYNVSKDVVNDITIFSLTIRGVKTEDSGHITCYVPAKDLEQSVRFEVYKQMASVDFLNATAQGYIHGQENVAMAMQCRAHRVVPVPLMSITVDNMDITELFKKQTVVNPYCDEEGATCIMHIDYTQRLFDSEHRPKFTYDGHKLKCSAQVPDNKYPPVTREVTMNITHAPHFPCSRVQYAPLHGQQAQVKCYVSANPGLQEVYWMVKPTEGQNIKVIPGQVVDEYTASQKVINRTVTEVTLTIRQVFQRHYIKYMIHAKNRMSGAPDVSMAWIQLNEETVNVGGGAGGLTAFILTSLTAALLTLFVH